MLEQNNAFTKLSFFIESKYFLTVYFADAAHETWLKL
jgi:hypothetical protein